MAWTIDTTQDRPTVDSAERNLSDLESVRGWQLSLAGASRLSSDAHDALIGAVVSGTVVAAQRWGVFVDVGRSHLGFIDGIYIDDLGDYAVGSVVRTVVQGIDRRKQVYSLRPPDQISLVDRLRLRGHHVVEQWDSSFDA